MMKMMRFNEKNKKTEEETLGVQDGILLNNVETGKVSGRWHWDIPSKFSCLLLVTWSNREYERI